MEVECQKCAYKWNAKHANVVSCARCKSREWNQPRRYGAEATEKRMGSWNKGVKWKKKNSGQIETDKLLTMDEKQAADKQSEIQNSSAQTKREVAIRITMMPRDTNAHGTVFGGIILSYIDVAGGVEAVRHTHHDRFITVSMREVVFLEPVFIGDLVSFYAETVKVGNTSIIIRVVVEAERFGSHGQSVRVTEAEVVYVAINQYREKVKIGK